jgi:SulP family sulfate permease
LSRVTSLDVTGARVLDDAISRLERRGIVVLLSGLSPRHDAILYTLGVADHLRASGRVFADTPAAIEHARTYIHPED